MAYRLIALFAMIALLFCANGCGKSADKGRGSEVVATIGKYVLMVDDLREEEKYSAVSRYPSGDSRKAKLELLGQIITKKALLQEAQRQDFDKDRAFMRMIERYWEQALLRMLMNRKVAEISSGITVSESEVRSEYEDMSKAAAGKLKPFAEMASDIKDHIRNRKIRDALDTWLAQLKTKTGVTVNRAIFERVRIE